MRWVVALALLCDWVSLPITASINSDGLNAGTLVAVSSSSLEIGVNGEVQLVQTSQLPVGAVVERVVLSLEYSTYWTSDAIAGNYVKLNGLDLPGLGWVSIGTGSAWKGVQALRVDALSEFNRLGQNRWRIGSAWNPVSVRNLTVTIDYWTPNQAPTDIALSAASLAENNAANATVGTLTATDVDAGSTHTFTLVSGTGSTDNAAFNLSGNALRLTSSANFEAKSNYSVRVRATDTGGLFFEKAFPITVTDVNDAPTMTLGVSATGGTKTTAGGFTVHTFTGPSEFTPAESGLVEVLLVGGGGGGGGSFAGGGGGGGGVVSSTSYAVNAGEPISVIVGLGGAGGSFSLQGKNGGDSHFGSLTAKGGGGGGTYPENKSGQVGGSGGGAGYAGAPGAGQVGRGSLGGAFGTSPSNHGGGGGGAGGTPDSSGIGGVGIVSSISGSASYYAGGGAAGTDDSVPLAGGLGGGGVGGQGFVDGLSGGSNTGGGGGGGGGLSSAPVGGAGGLGVVIVRYSSNVSDRTTLEDTATGSIAFTVGDVETAATALTVTATSSNLGVVAAGGIALGGSGANRTMTLTPVANASGTSTITVTVTDADGASATGSFTLTVTAVNDLPTISAISGQTTAEDTATSAIAFTVGDVETAVESLTVTATSSNLGVVAAGGIALGGSGASRTITLTPVANANGTSTITVTVTDAYGASATRSFAVTVTAVNDAPTVIAPASVAMTEDNAGNLTFTGTPFADIDSSILTVTLSVSDGTITGNEGTGITVWGTAIARIFSGTVSDLNTYFTTAGKITYQGALNNTENRTLTTTVSDGADTTVPPVSGYARWFDASTLNLANGASVVLWPDGSGSGYDAIKLSDRQAPKFVSDAGTGTGLGAVSFMTGVKPTGRSTDMDQALDFTRDTAIRSVFSVFKGSSFLLTDSGGDRYDFHRPSDDNPNDPLWVDLRANLSNPFITAGNTYVNQVLVNGSTFSMPTEARNGFNLVSVLTTGPVSADSFNRDRIFHSGIQSHAEVILYDRVLTDAERVLVENYLSAKWFGYGSGLRNSVTSTVNFTPVNDAPTITAIPDQTTLEDKATGAIAFTVGDVETAVGSLTVTATTSNLGVVAPGGIALGGSGANRTLTLTPVANASGTSTITVTVIDAGEASATRSFVLTVTAVNDAPTITAISDQTTLEDKATGAIAFTVGDVETAVGSLTVSATSSNPELIAASGMRLGSGDSSQGLIGRWSFDSVDDLGKNAVTGAALVKSGNPVWSSNGKIGGAVEFNGSSLLSASTSTIENLPLGNSSYSVSLWFKARTLNYGGFIGWGVYGSQNKVNAFRLNGNASLHNYWWANDLSAPTGSAMAPNVWYHAVATYDGTIRSIYLNGQKIASGVSSGADVQAGNFEIGKTQGPEYFDGWIDEVAIYNRALSETEITQLAQGAGKDRTITLTPMPNANGTSTITLTVTDEANATATTSFVLTVTPVNDAPTLTTVSALTGGTEDTALTISYATLAAAANEADVDGDSLSFRIEAVNSGTLMKDGVIVTAGATLLSSGESLVWTPASNANGTLNAFTVKAWDGQLASASAVQVSVEISAVNDAPVATGSATLLSIDEDSGAVAAGDLVANLFMANFNDAADSVTGGSAANSLFGIAVTSHIPDSTRGVWQYWQYSTSGGSWTALNYYSLSAAGFFRSTDRLRFLPASNYYGPATPLEARLIDSGGTPFTSGETVNTSGGVFLFSASANAIQLGHWVNPVNDTPVVVAGGSFNYTENAAAGVMSGTVTVSDVDSLQITGATVTISAGLTSGDVLGFTTQNGITGNYATSTGVLTLSGASTVGNYQTALRSVTYWSTSENPTATSASRTVSWQVTDADSASSVAVTSTISITAVNDAPMLTSVDLLTGGIEDMDYTITYEALAAAGNESDIDNSSVLFRIGTVSSGSLTKNGVAVTPGSTLLAAGESVVWRPAVNANGVLEAFTVTAWDGQSASSTAVPVQISVTAAPHGLGSELLVNPGFELRESSNSLYPLGWNSTVGFVVFTGSLGDYGPPAITTGGQLAFGYSSSVVVSQTAGLGALGITAVSEFQLEYRLARNQQAGIYWVQVEFLSASGQVLAQRRQPSSGTAAAPSTWTTETVRFNRGEIAEFDQITQVRVSLFGQQSPRIWAGHYGPFFDYVSLKPSLRTPLAVSGITALGKVYDATTSAELNTAGANLVGVVSGDSVNLSAVGAVGVFSSPTVGATKAVTVSGLTLSGNQAWKYSLVPPAGLTAAITAKTLTVSGLSGVNKSYDRTTAATVIGSAALSGVISRDTVTLEGTPVFTFASANVGAGIAITTTGYTLSGDQALNYALTQPTGLTGTITAKALSIGASTIASKVYDGTTAAGAVTVGALSGLVSPETLAVTGTAAAYNSAAVGTYSGVAVTYTLANGSGNTAGLASNYSLAAGSASGTITGRALTVTSPVVTSKAYDGTTVATITGTLSGALNSDTVSLVGTGTFASKNVGANQVVTSTSTLSGTAAANYALTQPTGLTGTITAKALSIGASTIASKVYDGTTAAGAVTVGALSGLVSPETLAVTGTAAAYSSAAVGTYSGVAVTYTLANGGSGNTAGLASNYSLAAGSASGTITGRALTVTSAVVTSKAYDGTTVATITGTLSGALNSDLVTLVGTGTFASKNVGANQVVTSTSTLSGTAAANYTLTQPTGLTGTITAKALSIGAPTIASKVYDGTTAAGTVTVGALSGLVSPETLVVTGTAAAYNSAAVGTYSGVAVTYTLANGGSGNTAGLASNYSLAAGSASGTVTGRALTVTSAVVTSKAYDGTTVATITGTLSGVLNTEAVTLVGTGTFASKNMGANQVVTSTSTLSGTAAANYTLTQPTGLTGTITAKALSIGAPTIASKVYDGTTAAGTVTVGALSGLVSPEMLTVSGTAAAYSSAAVGTYQNVVVTYTLANGSGNTAGLASNYSLAPGSATGTITPRELVITVDPVSLMSDFDGQSHGVLWTTTPAGISVEVLYNGSTTLPKVAGSYSVTLSSADPRFSARLAVTLVIRKTVQGITSSSAVVAAGLQTVSDSSGRYLLQATLGQPIAGPASAVSGMQLNSGFWFTEQFSAALDGRNLVGAKLESKIRASVILRGASIDAPEATVMGPEISRPALGVPPSTRLTVLPVAGSGEVWIRVSGVPSGRWLIQYQDRLHSNEWLDEGLVELDGDGLGAVRAATGVGEMRFYRLVQQ